METVVGRSGSEEKRSGLVGSADRRRNRSGLQVQGEVRGGKLLGDTCSAADLGLLISAERSSGAEEAGSSVARNVAGTTRSSRRGSGRARLRVGVVAAEHGELRELAVHSRHGRNVGISVGVCASEPASDAVLGRAAAGDAESAVLGRRAFRDGASVLGHVGHGRCLAVVKGVLLFSTGGDRGHSGLLDRQARAKHARVLHGNNLVAQLVVAKHLSPHGGLSANRRKDRSRCKNSDTHFDCVVRDITRD